MIETMLLAAGYSTRLYPLTTGIPKPLLPFLDARLLDYTLDYLQHFGVSSVATNAHHGKVPFLEQLGGVHGMDIRAYVEDRIMGTGGGIRNMASAVTGEHFLVVNCDFVCDVDLRAAFAAHRASGAIATLVLARHPNQDKFGAVGVDGSGKIVSFPREPHRVDDVVDRGLFTGIHFLRREALGRLPGRENFCIVKDAYQPWMLAGEDLRGFVSDARWLDVGEKDVFARTQFELLARPMSWMHPLRSAVAVEPPGFVAEGADVAADARLGPNVIVGTRAVIGREAVLENCVVFPGTSVPEGARHRDCILTPGEAVPFA